jgi:hypothetical protein
MKHKIYKSMGGSNAFEAIQICLVSYVDGQPYHGAVAFYALFIAGSCPPHQKSRLSHGFNSKKALKEFCAYHGIALWPFPKT